MPQLLTLDALTDNEAVLKTAEGSLVTLPRPIVPENAFVGQKLWIALSETEPLESAPAAILNEILRPHENLGKAT